MRYEDFVAQPRAHVERILHMLGEPATDLPFTGATELHYDPVHLVGGNPARFHATSTLQLRRDDAWQTQLAARDKLLVTLSTVPLLMRYGYRMPTGKTS